ncbi:MAG: hypothetical protein ACOCV8_04865, partial [Spirochaetota bacterium]
MKKKLNQTKELAKQVATKPVNTFIRLSTKHPVITILIVVLISLAIIPGIFKIERDNNIRGFLNDRFNTMVKTDYVEKTFNISKSIFYVAVESENIYSYDTLKYMKLFHNQLNSKTKDINSIIIDDIEYKNFNKSFIKLILDSIDGVIVNGKQFNINELNIDKQDSE